MPRSHTSTELKRSLELVHPTRVEEPVDTYFEAARGAFSRNTERALRSDVQVFRTWCREQVQTAFPASAATVAAFIDEMGRIKTPATVRRYTSSIATVHKALRETNPLDSAAVRFALQRMHRRRGRRQAQVQGLTWPLRNRLIEATGDRLIDARDRALLAVGYDTLLRRAELVAVRVPDLLEEMDGTATVLVRSGKTDGEGRGATLYLARDTVQLVKTWLDVGGVTADTCSDRCARTRRSGRSSTRARCRGSTRGWRDGPGFPPTSSRRSPGTAPGSGRCRT